MHLALQSQPIFHNILDCVDALLPNIILDDPLASPKSAPQGNMTLAALARTCRTFYEPSINVLWRTLRDIHPLIRTFPAQLWEEEVFAHNREGRPVYSLVSSNMHFRFRTWYTESITASQ